MLPIVLADLGAGDQPMRLSAWFVEPGDEVESGDRVVEVLVAGMTCDVPSPAAGRVTKLEKELDAPLHPGDVLAWIEPAKEVEH